ncbi:putative nuclease HARBI1 [Homarus americanus]|uniref:putative nuclease HARBI1 n=1 Tax=Homarus americanus TaxID=6706 RepID=UPI001C490F74|nr:putative nuclease HARBI1 [Homarus americanus]
MELVVAYLHDRALRRERRYRDPLDPINISDENLIRYYRFPRCEILRLCEELDPFLRRRTRRSHAVPIHTQVLVALRVYASGTFQHVLGDTVGLTQASVSRIIRDVTQILTERARFEIKMPTGNVQIARTVQGFARIRNLPRVIGAIDGTHIPIKAPIENEGTYVNRKRYHSLNVQVVCNADGLITNYSTKYPGCKHDAFIWANCLLRRRFEAGDFGDNYLIGDSGYPLEAFLMTPFRNPSTPGEVRYNNSHTKTRVVVEQTFGVLKSRFRCLHRSGGSLQYDPSKCAKIVNACFLLHNYCLMRRVPLPHDMVDDDGEIDNPAEAVAGTGQAVRANVVHNWFTG